jgi:tight adherence protein B
MEFLLNNSTVLFTVFGLSVAAMVVCAVLLVRVSLRDQTRTAVADRVKDLSSGDIVVGARGGIFLGKGIPPHLTVEQKSKTLTSVGSWLGAELDWKMFYMLIALPALSVPTFIVLLLFVDIYSALLVSVLVFAIGVGIIWIKKLLREKYLLRCELQLPEALDFIVRALRAGHAFPSAIQLVGDELAAPLGPQFQRVAKEQGLGIPLNTSLRRLTEKIPIMDMKYFLTAYLVNREVGGNLTEVLDNIASLIRERFKLKRHVMALTTEGRISAWVLGALPIGTATIVFLIRPDYFKFLISDPSGKKLILVSVIMWLAGIVVIRKLIHVEY